MIWVGDWRININLIGSMTSEADSDVDRDLDPAEVEAFNDDVMKDVIKEKSQNPPRYRSVWEDDQADEGTEVFDEEVETNPGKRLLWEAEHGELSAVLDTLQNHPETVKHSDSDGYTALHRASYNNHPEIIDLLVEKGANLSACTKEGWTPLHSASRWGHHKAVQRLLAAGANVNAQSTGKQAPLHLASVNREARKTVQLLLAHPDIDVSLLNGANEPAATISRRTGGHFDLFDAVEDCLLWIVD